MVGKKRWFMKLFQTGHAIGKAFKFNGTIYNPAKKSITWAGKWANVGAEDRATCKKYQEPEPHKVCSSPALAIKS